MVLAGDHRAWPRPDAKCLPEQTYEHLNRTLEDLMPLATWPLWLAHDRVQDQPLPWQDPQALLTPGRVADSIAPLLAQLGTPTAVSASILKTQSLA